MHLNALAVRLEGVVLRFNDDVAEDGPFRVGRIQKLLELLVAPAGELFGRHAVELLSHAPLDLSVHFQVPLVKLPNLKNTRGEVSETGTE